MQVRNACLVLLVALSVGSSVATAQGSRPTLALAQSQPLVLVGRNFGPAEAVALTVPARKTSRITLRADRRGSFSLTLRTIAVSRCSGFTVTAIGSRGSRAILKRLPLPACMP